MRLDFACTACALFVACSPAFAQLRLNQIQVIGSHNSYHSGLAPSEAAWLEKRNPKSAAALDYRHPALNVQLSSSSWIAARCCNEIRDRFGKSYGPIVLAYTSPVYVELADRPMRPDEEAITVFLKSLDSTIRWIEHEARVENNRQRERLIGIVLSARAELVRRAAV